MKPLCSRYGSRQKGPILETPMGLGTIGPGIGWGFTLMELLVVVVILGSLTAIASTYFNSYISRNNAEGDIKQIYSDLMQARAFAMTRARNVGLTFANGRTYVLVDDLNEDGDFSDSGETSTKVMDLKNVVSWNDSAANLTLSFNSRGISSASGTFSIGNADANYNCIIVAWTRINMGKMNGSTCEHK